MFNSLILEKDDLGKLAIKLIHNIFIIIFSFLFSQEALNINNIKVEGNIRLSDDDIIRISNIYPGMMVVSDEIHQGIKRLWNLDRFNDVQILLDSETELGINIIIKVDEAQMLNEIIFSGNKKIKDKKLLELAELEIGQIVTKKDITTRKRRT